jgi:recombination protein RecA
MVGTPGAPNLALHHSAQHSQPRKHEEQIPTDRQPARRGAYGLAQRELFVAQPQTRAVTSARQPGQAEERTAAKPWHRIDQALRVTDLLLQAGGFSVLVLDLADIAPEHVSRVPLATWFRFRAAAEHAQTALLVLTQHPCAKSSAALVVRCKDTGEIEQSSCFPGLRFSVEIRRQRFAPQPAISNVVSLRKEPQRALAATAHAAIWTAPAVWAGGQ